MKMKAIAAAFLCASSVLWPSVLFAQASELLSRAIDNNDAVAVESLCRQGADPNSLYGDQKKSWSVLHEAVSKGRYEVTAALLRAGADPNAESSYSYYGPFSSTLELAADRGSEELTALLIEYKADVNRVDRAGISALHIAARKGYGAVIGVLLAKGAMLEVKDKNGMTPLVTAVHEGQSGAARLLIEKGASIEAREPEGRTPLMTAAGAGLMDVVRLLIEKGADRKAVDDSGWTAFEYALGGGKMRVVEFFLDLGENPNSHFRDDSTPMELAIRASSLELVGLLTARGAVFKPDENGDFLRELARNSYYKPAVDFELMKWLIDRGEPVNGGIDEGETALVIAARRGDEALADFLLQRGAVTTGSVGGKALEGALQAGNTALAEKLLKAGAALVFTSIDPPRADAITPELIDFIVAHKIVLLNRATADAIFANAMIAAAEKNDAALAARLLDLGARGDARSMGAVENMPVMTSEATALHAAAKAGGLEMVKLLLAHGAAINFAIEIPNWKTVSTFIAPLDVALAAPDGQADNARKAVDARHMETARFLIARGAHPGPAFRYAIEVDDQAFFNFLLDSKCDVNAELFSGPSYSGGNGDDGKFTPLMFAAESGRLSMVQALIKRGARLNMLYTPICEGCDEEEAVTFDALLMAISRGYLEIADYLMTKGASIRFDHIECLTRQSAPDVEKPAARARQQRALLTRLIQRVTSIRPHTLVLLCELGDAGLVRLTAGKVDVNAMDGRGVTPLIAATRALHLEVVQWLLSRGARAAARDRDGKTAAEYLDTAPSGQADRVKAIRKMLERR